MAKHLELFIECDVQRVKESLKYRTPAQPEALFVNDKLANKALAAYKSQGIRQFDAVCPNYLSPIVLGYCLRGLCLAKVKL